MSLHPSVCADAAVAASQNAQVLEFFFVGPTGGVAANGSILALIPAQAVAQARVHLAIGSGNSSTATPSAAAVEALIKRPNGNSLSATEENIKTGVLALLGEVEALADGADAVAFAIGGLNARDVLSAELVVTSGAVADAAVFAQTASLVRIPEPVALVNGKLKKADGSAADLDTDKLIAVGGELNGSCSTVVGCFKIAEADKLSVDANNTLKLRVTVRN